MWGPMYQGTHRKPYPQVCILCDGYRTSFSHQEQVQHQSLAQHPLYSSILFLHFTLTIELSLYGQKHWQNKPGLYHSGQHLIPHDWRLVPMLWAKCKVCISFSLDRVLLCSTSWPLTLGLPALASPISWDYRCEVPHLTCLSLLFHESVRTNNYK